MIGRLRNSTAKMKTGFVRGQSEKILAECIRLVFRSLCILYSTETLLTVIPYSTQFVAIIIVCSLKLKVYQNRFWPGLCSGPRWGTLRRSPGPRPHNRQERVPSPFSSPSTPLALRQGAPSACGPRAPTATGIKTALCKSLRHFSRRTVLHTVKVKE